MLVHEILEYTAGRLPDKTALIEGEAKLTFAQIDSGVKAFSARLAELGVTKGDRIALLFPNCIEFCIAYFAIMRLGAIVVPLNNRLAAKEFQYIINDADPHTLIIGHPFWDTYLSFRDGLDHPLTLIYAGEERKEHAEYFADMIDPCSQVLSPPSISYDDPACIMYTSGTTGLPKGAVMTNLNIFTNVRNCGAHMGYREDDTTLIVVPLFHVTGLNTQLLAFFYVGGTTVIMRDYKTAEMINLLATHKVTTMIAVPTIYTLMLTNPDLESVDISSLHTLSYGGASMAPDTIRALHTRLGVNLINAYGLTETSSLATTMPPCDAVRKGSSVGLPVSGIQLRIVGKNGDNVNTGQVGELWVKGPNVVRTYWKKPEATAKNLGEGWLRTGDYARIDEEGYVYIVDRKKDMINRGGENVYSIEVESALQTNPKVLEAAVVPRSHTIFGEVVHAFVVPMPGLEPSEEEIILHCERQIADYKVPASVTFLEELPRNPGGKVLKRRLREMLPSGEIPIRRRGR